MTRFVGGSWPDLSGLAGKELRGAVWDAREWFMDELAAVTTVAWLFGSVARAKATVESDIDLLTVTNALMIRDGALSARISMLCGRRVHLVGSKVLDGNPLFEANFRKDAMRLHHGYPAWPEPRACS